VNSIPSEAVQKSWQLLEQSLNHFLSEGSPDHKLENSEETWNQINHFILALTQQVFSSATSKNFHLKLASTETEQFYTLFSYITLNAFRLRVAQTDLGVNQSLQLISFVDQALSKAGYEKALTEWKAHSTWMIPNKNNYIPPNTAQEKLTFFIQKMAQITNLMPGATPSQKPKQQQSKKEKIDVEAPSFSLRDIDQESYLLLSVALLLVALLVAFRQLQQKARDAENSNSPALSLVPEDEKESGEFFENTPSDLLSAAGVLLTLTPLVKGIHQQAKLIETILEAVSVKSITLEQTGEHLLDRSEGEASSSHTPSTRPPSESFESLVNHFNALVANLAVEASKSGAESLIDLSGEVLQTSNSIEEESDVLIRTLQSQTTVSPVGESLDMSSPELRQLIDQNIALCQSTRGIEGPLKILMNKLHEIEKTLDQIAGFQRSARPSLVNDELTDPIGINIKGLEKSDTEGEAA